MSKNIPKSKISIKKTTEGFMVKSTGEPYQGDYIETSNKKYYAGKDALNLNIEIVKIEESPNNIGQSLDADKFTILQKSTYQKLTKHDTLPGSKTIPTEEDYNRGYFIRYYLIRVNSDYYKEINIETYTKYNTKKKIDENLYNIGKIKWAITGDVMHINRNMLILQERKHPGITKIFPIYNEFERIANYNIKGRTYPDFTDIPSQLPPSYDLPKIASRNCQNCFYNKNKGLCMKWNANIRSNYWCKSWFSVTKATDKNLLESFGTDEEFDNYFVAYMDRINRPTPSYIRPQTTDLKGEKQKITKKGSGGSSGGGGGGY